jgi:hypothetical protein
MTDWVSLCPAVNLGDAVVEALMTNITSEYVVSYEACMA